MFFNFITLKGDSAIYLGLITVSLIYILLWFKGKVQYMKCIVPLFN